MICRLLHKFRFLSLQNSRSSNFPYRSGSLNLFIFYFWAAAGFPFVVALCRLYFCKPYVGLQPTPANKNISRHFSNLPLQSLPRAPSVGLMFIHCFKHQIFITGFYIPVLCTSLFRCGTSPTTNILGALHLSHGRGINRLVNPLTGNWLFGV